MHKHRPTDISGENKDIHWILQAEGSFETLHHSLPIPSESIKIIFSMHITYDLQNHNFKYFRLKF